MKKVDEKAQKRSSEKLILDSESIPEHGQKELGVYIHTRHKCISASLILFRLLIEFDSLSLSAECIHSTHTSLYSSQHPVSIK
jgi:hypothetical protein